MKATAVGLLIFSVYLVKQGLIAWQDNDTATAIEAVVLGILLLPVAKYVWDRNLGPRP